MSDFQSDGAGKLIGPNGNEMDTEEFLSSLQVYSGSVFYNFNVVTQKYGKGIVEYGSVGDTSIAGGGQGFPGGKYDDICTADGKIYLSVDVSEPPLSVLLHLWMVTQDKLSQMIVVYITH